ncbi:hypothetical protein P4V86_05110 [Brevibacillus laterosporus]|uniref:hypothetical protein n=1 Tax=Brevibacillus laterosporus TaxID=1465 RepID=UPI00036795B7|nr:hypothetical protein [Brevibacillus laterosporus]ATO51398.1 hypothetical protein BrL25_21225 [Brevibacillus laterosporus DSM 25]MED2002735.1 hypothetical protein [Brevibacillus laterosporus]
MIGYLNKCPHCKKEASFVLEELECDKSLIAWCRSCGNYINQTFTLETFRKWWERYQQGEEKIEPPIKKEMLEKLKMLEEAIALDSSCNLNRVEIHLKDFTDYVYKNDGE